MKAGGEVVTYIEANDQSKQDLLTMEAIAVPLSFVVLVWVFGGLLAAAVPLAVGGFAIVGSMAVMRGLASFTEVSIFALNLIMALGLALAIDYTLLIVSRTATSWPTAPNATRHWRGPWPRRDARCCSLR